MTRILLARDVDRHAVEQAALSHGWPLLNIFARRDGRPRQTIYGSAEWLLTFVEDHRVDAHYAVVAGHDPDTLAEQVRDALASLDLEHVLAQLETDRLRGLCWLGVVGPTEPCDPVAALLREAAGSSDEQERSAARFALEALGWSP